VAQPQRPGRKPGQGRFGYRPTPSVEALSEPPISMPVTAPVCPHRGGTLVADGAELALITDLPEQPRPIARQYHVGISRCQSCGRRVRGRHPEAHRLGPRLLAAAQSLHYQHGVPVRRVPAILADLVGVRVTQGALTHVQVIAFSPGC